MRRLLFTALLASASISGSPALADTLVDNVDGMTLNAKGEVEHFTGLLIGWRFFGMASDRTYRRVTFALILFSAFLALPVFDSLFAGIAAGLRGGE